MWLDADFGVIGLTTVGYRLYDTSGSDILARTTTGVVEVGGGAYGVNNTAIPAGAVGIEWDTGESVPVYAHESLPLTANDIWAHVIESGNTAEQLVRIICASAAGKTSGAGTGVFRMRSIADDKDRIVATIVDKNRTAIVLNGS